MTNDAGRKPEGGAGALSQSWRRRPFGRRRNGPKRFSVQRKMAIVARLLRGEPLELVVRETNVSIARLSYSKVAAIEVVTVEHANSEVVGIHAPWSANRFEALEPVRQGVHLCFGAMAPRVARGLKLRHDHGSNYMSLCAGGLMKYAPLAFHTRGRISQCILCNVGCSRTLKSVVSLQATA